jgi:hypothetical protein
VSVIEEVGTEVARRLGRAVAKPNIQGFVYVGLHFIQPNLRALLLVTLVP